MKSQKKSNRHGSSFCYYFLPRVSKMWQEALKDSSSENQFHLTEYSTVSDEALTRWIIDCRYNSVKEDYDAGFPAKGKEAKGKKSGPHDSLAHIAEYVELNKNIKAARGKVKSSDKWNKLFWKQFDKELKNDPDLQSKNRAATNTSHSEVPLPTIDDDFTSL